MRTIKFRVWNAYKMIHFDLTHDFTLFNDHVQKTLMQFTGLLDKSGKEIFEGDIVHGAKTFGGDVFTYEVKYQPEDEWCWNFPTGLWNSLEVIGNIWENKELLNG